MDRLPWGGQRPVGNPDLVVIVAAADARHVVLMGKDMVAQAAEYPGQGSTGCLQPLSRLSGNFDREIHAVPALQVDDWMGGVLLLLTICMPGPLNTCPDKGCRDLVQQIPLSCRV